MSTGDRLRDLFLSEAANRMSALDEGLLALEASPDDADAVDKVFREAHSLKGSAAMVGLPEVGAAAHALEDRLEEVRRGHLEVTAEIVDELLADADAIRTALEAAAAPAEEPPDPDDEGGEAVDAAGDEASEGDEWSTLRPVTAQTSDASLERLPVALDLLDELVRLSGEVRTGLVRLRSTLDAHAVVRDNDELRDVEQTARTLQRRVASARTVQVSMLDARLRRAVRDAARARGLQVTWRMEGGETQIDRVILTRLEDALVHMVRNSVAHGIEPMEVRTARGKPAAGSVWLSARSGGGRVRLTIGDDGKGLDERALRQRAEELGVTVDGDDWTSVIFRSGVTTAADVDELSGRGVGMDVVAQAVRDGRGAISVETRRNRGTQIVLDLPVSLAVTRCLEVSAAGARYAIALDHVDGVMTADRPREQLARGVAVAHGDRTVPLFHLADLLGRRGDPDGPIVLLADGADLVAVGVDALVGQREITSQPVGGGLPSLRFVDGVSMASDGTALVVLDALELVRHAADAAGRPSGPSPTAEPAAPPVPRRRVLVVDDALTIRELQRGILEKAGYDVLTAVDGRDALALLVAEQVDLVMTDVEMPRMDGFALTEHIRDDDALRSLPVVILTTLDDPVHRQRGMEAGADGYMLKSSFTAEQLLATVAAQIGAP